MFRRHPKPEAAEKPSSPDVATAAAALDQSSTELLTSEKWRKALLSGLLERYKLQQSKSTMEQILDGEAAIYVPPLLQVLHGTIPLAVLHVPRALTVPRLSDDTWAFSSTTPDRRAVCVRDFLSNVLKSGLYDARARVLLRDFALWLDMSLLELAQEETQIADKLTRYRNEHQAEVEAEMQEQERRARNSKWFKVGVAGVIGGVAIGLTGGLAAPLVAAGMGAVFGTGAAVALGTTAGIYAIGTLFAVGGTSLTGYHMHRRVGKLEEFYFMHLSRTEQLDVTICVSGWAPEDEPLADYVNPWLALPAGSDYFALVWEREPVHALTRALTRMLKDQAVGMAVNEVIKHTLLAGLMAAVAWPAGLLKVASLLDNSWSVALNRADHAGVELANVLLSRQQGGRPVRLVGYALGARVIFSCLQELAKRKQSQGLVESVVMMGLPASGAPDQWKQIDRVVAGSIQVLHSTEDWLLKFLFRGTSVELVVAGVEGVMDVPFVQNVNVTALVGSWHSNYHAKFRQLLGLAGLSENGQMQYRVAMSQEPEAAALAAATGVQAVEDDFMAQPGCALVVTDAGPSINVQEQRRFKRWAAGFLTQAELEAQLPVEVEEEEASAEKTDKKAADKKAADKKAADKKAADKKAAANRKPSLTPSTTTDP
ncbi:uncharacterized protein MONBRDRAFT_9431 [Monosiga brevicollis MX1]|uniref:Transmembrane and coiled-coil domain-containing protein 4 n=1 Tax=Monosiga brevicollis TaxID=81824 RepID=A9V345_MONBE|nr:uncharacterized protein MONBRDRAFT_9431 [Monosiga brevicollis MX1]EDQ88124.1 predicted protein [Monosiga brevicollis MX1]|eukprot:XP_001747200.1 hypothetical protein [Monosiga brevicollis MX1]